MTKLRVRELTPAFGAEVEGIDPSAALDAGVRRELGDLFDERAILLFRGPPIDKEFQEWLVGMLIERVQPSDDTGSTTFGTYISNERPGAAAPFGRLQFHSDGAWCSQPTRVVSLYAEDVRAPVVPTLFTSTTLAWEKLSPELQDRVDTLCAVQVTGQVPRGENAGELLQFVREHTYSTETPIGWVHPSTGRRMLYVSPMTTAEIAGLGAEESEALLERLFEYLGSPGNLWQHEWRNHDLVVWDNLAILHARSTVTDDGPVRTLLKVSAPTMPPGFEFPTYAPVGADGT